MSWHISVKGPGPFRLTLGGTIILRSRFILSSALLAVVCGSACGSALAIEDRADTDPNESAKPGGGIAWKLTPNYYRETAGRSAIDLNLRGNRDNDTFWIGQYHRGAEFQQTRAGYEHQLTLPFGKIIASGQLASRGFLGGSITLEASASAMSPSSMPFVGLLGWGRTNRKPYYNLNFDPNDSVLIGVGWRPNKRTALTVFQVRDDRLGTGQRVTHIVLRQQTGERSRWTIDLFDRAGRADSAPDSENFHAMGVAITYDLEPWFARIAWDPKVNYTNSDMTRLAIGVRF